jgi:aryl carrier-like protein
MTTATTATTRTSIGKIELIEKFSNITGCIDCNLVTVTEVKMNKTGNPYLGAVKVSKVWGKIGSDYSNGVNNQLGRQGENLDFVAMAHKWARVSDFSKNWYVDCKTGSKIYLKVIIGHKSAEKAEAEKPSYFFNGKEIDVELLKPFMVAKSKPKTQDKIDEGKEIIFRLYGIDSIKAINLLSERYEVSETETLADAIKTEVRAREIFDKVE